MSIWWILSCLLAANPAMGTRLSYPLETNPLAQGLQMARKPKSLVLMRDGEIVDQLPLPSKPQLARRKEDHAVLALSRHGLWIIRITPEGRLRVIARHRISPPVDGFFFEKDRVVPTAAGSPIVVKPKIRFNPPPRDPVVLPVGERLQALSPDTLERMESLPEPKDMGPPVSARPLAFLESNFFISMPFPAWTRDVYTGHRTDLVALRAGFHLLPNHVLGASISLNIHWDSIHYKPHERYLLTNYASRSFLFYRYSMPSRRLEFHVEPMQASIMDFQEKDWDLVWGVRLGVAWVKRSGPLRIGVEGRLDVFKLFILPSWSMIFGFNF